MDNSFSNNPEDNRIIDSNPLSDDAPDKALRPSSFDQFIGQKLLKKNLLVFVSAARQRAEALDHSLLYGPPGLGKTTMAQIISKELGVGFRATSGPVISKAGDLAAILTNLQERDVLFIDEIHRLPINVEEVLYPAMEDGKLDIMIGEGPAARSIQIDLPPFTLVGATTRLGLLSNPLRDRFGIPLQMNFYDHDELCQILYRAASLLNLDLTDDGAIEIAKRGRGTPRVAIRLLRRIRDFVIFENQQQAGKQIVMHALSQLNVDQLGLDDFDRRYLGIIAKFYDGGPVGIDTLAAAMAESRGTIEETIEPYLLQIGFLQRTNRGRVLSNLGWQHLGLNPPIDAQKENRNLQTELFEEE